MGDKWWRSILQASNEKHECQSPLPMRRYLQRPKRWNWETQHDEVCNDVDHSASNDHSNVVDTFWSDSWSPLGTYRNALEDCTKHLGYCVGDDEDSQAQYCNLEPFEREDPMEQCENRHLGHHKGRIIKRFCN